MSYGFIATLGLTLCFAAAPCLGAPANDDWANRTVIGALPFSDSVQNIQDATVEALDPAIFCVGLNEAVPQVSSVWYRYSPGVSDAYINIDASGYDTLIEVLEGNPAQGFTRVRGGCNDDAEVSGRGSIIRGLRLRAGGDYSILVARYTPDAWAFATTLSFSLRASPIHQVTKLADTNDGACDADCSLREAIAASAGTGSGAVLVPAGRYVLTSSLVSPVTGFAIYGAGMDRTVVDANGTGRVLDRSAGRGTLMLSQLSLVNGRSATSGGALTTENGYVVLDRVAVRDNIVTGTGSGGGIYFYGIGSESFYDCEFTGNRAEGGAGGGLYALSDHTEIINSTFSDNQSSTGSNLGGGGGAAILDQFLTQVTNSTFSGNRTNGRGGALYLRPELDLARVELRNDTLVYNTHDSGGEVASGGGLFIASDLSTPLRQPVTVLNSVLYGNRDGSNSMMQDCAFDGVSMFTAKYSLAGAPGNCAFDSIGDMTGVNPMLMPLARLHSVLAVHVPQSYSPLIDSGDPVNSCTATDQRGIARPQDGDADGVARCDIGAIERQAADELIFTNGFEG